MKSVERVANAFPQLGKGFYKEFTDVLLQDQIPDSRLRDAVDHVIRNSKWPSISDFLNYDKRVRLYNYSEAAKQSQDTQVPMDKLFICLKDFQGRTAPVWINISDYELIKHLVK